VQLGERHTMAGCGPILDDHNQPFPPWYLGGETQMVRLLISAAQHLGLHRGREESEPPPNRELKKRHP
jgi:hypothetical protein